MLPPLLSLIVAGVPLTQSTCSGIACAVPSDWDDFTNNIGIELAPILTLFGEQVTKQFLSESMSDLDNLLFCLAPLGVITAVVAAIHVSGSPGLRALVGRAKESRGQVESDLMSSSSQDVCELWSGEGVVRVMGRPVLLQMVCVEDFSRDHIYTLKEAIDKGYYMNTNRSNDSSRTGRVDLERIRRTCRSMST